MNPHCSSFCHPDEPCAISSDGKCDAKIDERWDTYFLQIAAVAARKSKDPSTQVGAVIVRPDRTIVSVGYNGFPRGVADTPERLNDRPTKYSLVVHAEMNAILSARESLNGYTLYTVPFMPCDRCFVHVIQAGIKRVVFHRANELQQERWGEAFQRVWNLAFEVNIQMVEYIV
jgi:dCMP deaminase